jgi:hypothetical protein
MSMQAVPSKDTISANSTLLITVLEKHDLIQRGDKSEARKRPVALTIKGHKQLKEAYVLREKAQSNVENKFSGDALQIAKHALIDIRKSVSTY